MNKFPSKKIMLPICFCIIIIFYLKFTNDIKKTFFQLRFDWKNSEIINSFDLRSVNKITYNNLNVRLNNSKNIDISNQNTFALVGKNIYYFRFTYDNQTNDIVNFEGVTWFNNQPDFKNENFTKINILNVPLKIGKKATNIATLGDDLIFKDEAKYLRYYLLKNKEINFEGIDSDIFNTKYFDINKINKNTIIKSNILIIFSKNYNDNFYYFLNNYLKNNKNIVFILTSDNKSFDTKKIINQNKQINFIKINKHDPMTHNFSKIDYENIAELIIKNIDEK